MKPMKYKKYLFLLPILLLALFLFSGLLFSGTADRREFSHLTENLLEQELSGNTLDLHYTFAYPENYDITYEPTLPCYSSSDEENSLSSQKDYLEKLGEIDIKKLKEDHQYTYLLLEKSLNHAKDGQVFSYYDEPLSPSSGMQSTLPILLAEYTFRRPKDVEDYLSLLDQTDEYFSALLVYEQEKKEAGLLQADASLDKVCEQCYSILTRNDLENGTHFLQTTFSERLLCLRDEGLITEEEMNAYMVENDRLLTTVMLPAYEKLGDGLYLLKKEDGVAPVGLGSYPQGREYYAWLVQQYTGSSRSMEELKKMLYERYEQSYGNLKFALNSNENAFDLWIQATTGANFPLQDSNAMLTDLQARMAGDFPVYPDSGGGTLSANTSVSKPVRSASTTDTPDGIRFTSASGNVISPPRVKNVSKNLEDYCAPAFYLTPPLDDANNNIIYINQKNAPAGLELYTTLAHEGYPGHLYQSVYSQLSMQKKETDPVRRLLWYGGYLEGWAIYVELLSYEYAIELVAESDASGTGNVLTSANISSSGETTANIALGYEIERYNRDMQLCLLSILDIAIHYDGASEEQVAAVLSSLGMGNAETAKNVYEYIAEEPGNYLKYYIGYLEILELKEEAKEIWKEDYSDLRFHTFYLDMGPADFDTLFAALHES